MCLVGVSTGLSSVITEVLGVVALLFGLVTMGVCGDDGVDTDRLVTNDLGDGFLKTSGDVDVGVVGVFGQGTLFEDIVMVGS